MEINLTNLPHHIPRGFIYHTQACIEFIQIFTTPRAVLMKPEIAALKAVLVRMSTLVASRLRIVQVSSRRLVQVIMVG